ncbi:MAG: NAD(P)H-dependent glycerol-3-phosphate dehydrogenase, partial [Gammaproteobacteria bacterium]|nr:NAD(P)H-dependent glycerol-3-phosphate dehydrogenase [Gammaproteobacteria bacterium]
MTSKKIAILGAGMFGTAIANIVAENGRSVWLWGRDSEQVTLMARERENTRYLPGYTLHDRVTPTADLKTALSDADSVFVSVPSASFREVARSIRGLLRSDAMLISTTKGVEHQGFCLMSQVLEDEIGGHPMGVLSGPNLADEIARKQITATVVASRTPELIARVQTLLHTAYFRVYSSDDVYGVELAGALKNIYAIASGFASALGVGGNTMG